MVQGPQSILDPSRSQSIIFEDSIPVNDEVSMEIEGNIAEEII